MPATSAKHTGFMAVMRPWLGLLGLRGRMEAAKQQLRAQMDSAADAIGLAERMRESAFLDDINADANKAATSPRNDLSYPTQAQIESGNYKKGHIKVAGLDIAIENPAGSERSGMRPDGSIWRHKMSHHYGYIKRTEGMDGDCVDVYVGPNVDSGKVFVVDQLKNGKAGFDEHKCMIGFDSEAAAIAAYRKNFDPVWKVGPVTEMTIEQFKHWLHTDEVTKPAAEATLDSASGLSTLERMRLNSELSKLRSAMPGASLGERMRGNKRMAEIRVVLGAGKAAPVPEAPKPALFTRPVDDRPAAIYTDGTYSIMRHGPDMAKLSNNGKSQTLRLRKTSDLTPQQITQIRKMKLNPDDYVGVDTAIIRRAAQPAWDSAVDQMLADRKAATAARAAEDADLIAREGKRALIFHGNYLMNASLAYVVPKENGTAKPVGDWTSLDRDAVKDFWARDTKDRAKMGLESGVESSVVLLSEAEWDQLVNADRAAKAAKAEAKQATVSAKAARIEAARAQAERSGSPVEIDRELINSESEDGFVALIRMIRGDGTTFTKRQILG